MNALCPWFVRSEMLDGIVAHEARRPGVSEAEVFRQLTELSPQKRILEPQEIADLACYLCAKGARGVTGQALVIVIVSAFYA